MQGECLPDFDYRDELQDMFKPSYKYVNTQTYGGRALSPMVSSQVFVDY